MQTRSVLRAVAVLAVAACAVSVTACTVDAAEEPAGSTAAAQTESTCGSYPKNPACNQKFFLQKAWELGQKDVIGNVAAPVGEATGCLVGLAAAGAILAGTSEVPPVSVAAAAKIGELLGTIAACNAFAQYLDRIGLPANLSCWLEPVVYSEEVFLCQCREACKAGRHNSGQLGDYSAPRKFTYGYMDRAGSSNCYCTNDAKEARCQWSCEKGFRSTAADDCTCK